MKKTHYALVLSLAALAMAIQPSWSQEATTTDATAATEFSFDQPVITAMAMPAAVLEAIALPTAVIDGKRYNVLGHSDDATSFRKYREANTLRARKPGDDLYHSHVRISIGLGPAFVY